MLLTQTKSKIVIIKWDVTKRDLNNSAYYYRSSQVTKMSTHLWKRSSKSTNNAPNIYAWVLALIWQENNGGNRNGPCDWGVCRQIFPILHFSRDYCPGDHYTYFGLSKGYTLCNYYLKTIGETHVGFLWVENINLSYCNVKHFFQMFQFNL